MDSSDSSSSDDLANAYDPTSGEVRPSPLDRFPLGAYDDLLAEDDQDIQQLLEQIIASASAPAEPAPRSTAAHKYPGDVLECMAAVCPPGFDERKLWANQPQIEDSMYMQHFRMGKEAFSVLLRIASPSLESLRPAMQQPKFATQHSYSHSDILAMTLFFLGHGTTFLVMQSVFGRPDSTVAILVKTGLVALFAAMWLCKNGEARYVEFPATDSDKAAVIAGFQTFLHGLRQCIGAIDGSLIQMRKPTTVQVQLRALL